MDERRRKMSEEDSKFAILAVLCTLPLFILFAYFGDPGRGQAAFVTGLAVEVAARLSWNLRNHIWYWITLAVIVLLHVPLILLIPWPFKQLTYVALLPAALFDFAITYGIIRLIEKTVGNEK